MEFPRDQDEQRKVMYEAQLRTNELLEKLIESKITKTTDAQKTAPDNKPIQRRGRKKS